MRERSDASFLVLAWSGSVPRRQLAFQAGHGCGGLPVLEAQSVLHAGEEKRRKEVNNETRKQEASLGRFVGLVDRPRPTLPYI